MSIEELRAARNRTVATRRRKREALARLQGQPVGPVDAAPIRSKARALLDLGWSHEAIIHAARCTGTSAGLRLLAGGTSRKAERKFAPVAALPVSLHVPEHVPDTCLVPTLGATRRVRALMALGWRHEDISEFISRASHHISAGRHKSMLAADWRLVDAAYNHLSAAVGGSQKSARRAIAAGFVPPLGWDDIDDPTEVPRDWAWVAPDRGSAIRDIHAAGQGAHEACRRLEAADRTLEKWCARNDMRDLWRELVARDGERNRNQHTEDVA